MRLIDNWKAEAKRLWSFHLVILFGVIQGLMAVWSGFQDVLPLWLWAFISILMFTTIGIARFIKQPGADDADSP